MSCGTGTPASPRVVLVERPATPGTANDRVSPTGSPGRDAELAGGATGLVEPDVAFGVHLEPLATQVGLHEVLLVHVMGTTSETERTVGDKAGTAASTLAGTASSAGHATTEAASAAVDTVSSAAQQAPAVAKQKATGNPIAAGVVAFGLGWLVSSLLPASQKEQEAASQLKDVAQQAAEPAKQALTEAASEVKENLAPVAEEAVQSVKDTTTDAAATVKEQAADASSQVKDQATGAATDIADTAKSAAEDAKEQATAPAEPEPTVALVVEDPVAPYAEDPSMTSDPLTSGTTYGDPSRGNLRPPL